VARTLGTVDPLDPSNPIIERRSLDPNIPWFFFDKDRPAPFLPGFGPPPPLSEGKPSDREKPSLPPIPEPPSLPKTLWPLSGGPLMTPSFTQGAGYVGAATVPSIPFVPDAPQGVPGGLLGLMIESGLSDPLTSGAPLPGGLAGLIREYLRDNPRGSK
jgi:hypothetical protein